MVPTKEMWRAALVQRHGEELQQRFECATVAICGLGGLGSHIATALARAGVGRLLLIDFDSVDLTNLHRQQYRVDQIGTQKAVALKEILASISPYTRVEAYCERITEQNIKALLEQAEIVCEAFDDAEYKAMLVNGVLTELPGTDLVAASGMAGLESANQIQTRRVTKHFYLCGDGKTDVEDSMGLVSTRVMACAAHQAHMVLRILAGEKES